jgi:hypothetical protein
MAVIDRKIGRQIAGQPFANEGDQFILCEFCGQLFDCRDLAQVLVHEGHAHTLIQRKPPAPNM